MEVNFTKIGERLRFARKNSQLSLEEVGKIINIHKGSVSRWENGRTEKIQLPVLEKLADIYNVNVMWLMGYDVPMNKLPSDKKNNDKYFKYASYQAYKNDPDLDKEDIEEIDRFIEFIKNKKNKK